MKILLISALVIVACIIQPEFIPVVIAGVGVAGVAFLVKKI